VGCLCKEDENTPSVTDHLPSVDSLADEWINGIRNTGHSGWEMHYGEATSENLKPVRYRCFGCVGVEILGGIRRFGSVEVYELVFF
jgi:hypothetical protein